jgi:hypothetical protein
MASVELPYVSMGHSPNPETVQSLARDVHQCLKSNPTAERSARRSWPMSYTANL